MANSSELFQNLRKYVKGQIDKYELERSDSSIDYVTPHQTKGLSEITFEFKYEDEYLEKLGLGDDDMWFYRVIMNPYGEGYTFRDPDLVQEDFYNGYAVFYEFDNDNIEKLLRILKIIDPKTNYGEFPSEDENKKAANILSSYFEKETDRIVDDWSTEREIAANQAAREHISQEVENYLARYDFKPVGYSKVKIKVVDLINNYLLKGKIWLSFSKLFEDIFNPDGDVTREIGGWDENRYEYEGGGNFDNVSFNRTVDLQLDKMIDKLESLENIKQFVAMTERIKKKYKVGVTYDLPKLPGVSFRIKDFDREKMKIDVTLRKGLQVVQKKLSEEDFYKLLYQPELFYSEFGHMGKSS